MTSRYSLLLSIAATISVLFTNCGGFEAAISSKDVASAACIAKLQSASDLQIDLRTCENMNNYSCERRTFSPDVANGDVTQDECGDLSTVRDVCVSTRTLSFNTGVASANASAEQFAEGGDYNHEEYKCSHTLQNDGIRIFQESGTSVFDALENAINACKQRAAQ